MITASKCDYCVHECVCRKKENYAGATRQVENSVPFQSKNDISIKIDCLYYLPKSFIKRGDVK